MRSLHPFDQNQVNPAKRGDRSKRRAYPWRIAPLATLSSEHFPHDAHLASMLRQRSAGFFVSLRRL